MRLRPIERAVLPVALAALTIAAPGLLRAAAVRRTKHAPTHKIRLHAVPARHAAYVRTHHGLTHPASSRHFRHKYRGYTVHGHRYHKRVSRFRMPAGPSSDRIDQIQQALSRSGFYQGNPSGTWDPETVGAMKNFQQAHGLAPTGKIDATTLQQLGLGSDVAGLAPPRPLIAANGPGSSE